MPVSKEIVEQRMQAFRKGCAERGLKVTHQRLEVFRVIASTDEHPEVETLHRRVRKRIPTISLDTVYRNLKLLAEEGFVSVVGMSHERLRFDANMKRHHHFVCIRCGKILDFYSERLERMETPPEAAEHGRALSLQMDVKGLCKACDAAAKGDLSRV